MQRTIAATIAIFFATSISARSETLILKYQDFERGDKSISNLLEPLAKPPNPRTVEGRSKIASSFLGKGFDLWGSEALPTQCIAFPAKYVVAAPTPAGTQSAENWTSINEVSSLSEHFKSESLGASATVTYKIFSLGGSGSSSSSNRFSSFSRYIDVDKGVISDSYFIVQPLDGAPLTLSDVALKKVSDAKLFSRMCGQHYIWKIGFGSLIKGTIDFEIEMGATTSTSQKEISAGISGILGGSINTSNTWNDLSQKSSIRYNVTGGPVKSGAPEEWIPNIRNFGSQPADAQSNDVIVIKTRSYNQLPGKEAANLEDVVKEAAGTLSNLQWSVSDSIQKLTDRQKALSNLAHVTEPEADIRADALKLAKYIDDTQIVYKSCSQAITEAGIKTCKDAAALIGLPPIVGNITPK